MRQILFVSLAAGSLFVLLLILERLRPLRLPLHSLGEILLNLAISGLAFAAAAWMVRPAVMTAIQWTARSRPRRRTPLLRYSERVVRAARGRPLSGFRYIPCSYSHS